MRFDINVAMKARKAAEARNAMAKKNEPVDWAAYDGKSTEEAPLHADTVANLRRTR